MDREEKLKLILEVRKLRRSVPDRKARKASTKKSKKLNGNELLLSMTQGMDEEELAEFVAMLKEE